LGPARFWAGAVRRETSGSRGAFGRLQLMAGSDRDKLIGAADLEAIAARCGAASKGPWEVLEDRLVDTAWLNAATPDDDKPIALFDYRSGTENKANAAFVAAARSDVPMLLQLVKSLSKRVEELLEANNREIAARVEANKRLQEALARTGAAADKTPADKK
jgi:hypothetical protein